MGLSSHPDRKMPLGKAFVLETSRNSIKLSKKNARLHNGLSGRWLLSPNSANSVSHLHSISRDHKGWWTEKKLKQELNKSWETETQQRTKDFHGSIRYQVSRFPSLALCGRTLSLPQATYPLTTSLSVSIFCGFSKFLISNSSKWNFSAFILCPPSFPPSLHFSFLLYFFLSAPKSTKEPNRTSLSI